jgi:hypothetical protein
VTKGNETDANRAWHENGMSSRDDSGSELLPDSEKEVAPISPAQLIASQHADGRRREIDRMRDGYLGAFRNKSTRRRAWRQLP